MNKSIKKAHEEMDALRAEIKSIKTVNNELERAESRTSRRLVLMESKCSALERKVQELNNKIAELRSRLDLYRSIAQSQDDTTPADVRQRAESDTAYALKIQKEQIEFLPKSLNQEEYDRAMAIIKAHKKVS